MILYLPQGQQLENIRKSDFHTGMEFVVTTSA